MYFDHGPMPGDKRVGRSGYTLIEVLVATAVFSAMALLAGMAINQGLMQYQGLVDRGLNFWSHAQKIWLDKSFHSTVDYYVRDSRANWFPYFVGNQEGVSYVSLAPLAGYLPAVVWIRKEAKENGTFSLVYYELPVCAKSYQEIEGDSATGEYQKGWSVKLLEGEDHISFKYYGYDVRDEKHRWRDVHECRLAKRLPLLVQITCTHGGEDKKLMFGIHVNSNLKIGYRERYEQ